MAPVTLNATVRIWYDLHYGLAHALLCKMTRTTIYKTLLSIMAIMSIMAIAALFVLPGPAYAGQRFEYDLKWGFVLAGHSVLEHIDAKGDSPARVESSTISADWITTFYPVRDYVRAELDDPENFYPSNYRIQTVEGTHEKDREVKFSRAEGKAVYIDHLKGKKNKYEIPEQVHDPLSAFFRIKGMPLEVGKSVYINIFDSKKLWLVEVKVHKKERITVPAGTFDTVMIQPLMKSEGIFDAKGNIYIWLTDDERRIPVKVRSKIVIGSMTVLLTGGKY